MLSGKILIVLALYIILGIIAVFNISFHHQNMNGNAGWKGIVNYAAGKTLDEKIIEDTQLEVSQGSKDLRSN